MQWDTLFAQRTTLMKRSPVRELLKFTTQPEVISFAGGLPAPELFPIQRFQQATDIVLSKYGPQALQYSTTEGMPELRNFLAKRLSSASLSVSPDNILIVTGSQQALDLIARVFLNERDRMIVENPTYLGMLLATRLYNLTYLPVPTDDKGAIVEHISDLMPQAPKLMYMVPNYQNPKGTTLSTERRNELIKLVHQYSIPLVEDNPYGELCYNKEIEPSLMELDAQNLGTKDLNGHIIYTGTFSKVLAPGLRVGWIAAPQPVIEKLVEIKQSADLHTSTLAQFITYEVVRDGFLDRHIECLRQVYRERRDIMLDAMEKHFPDEVTWTRPEGGLFFMVYMPQHLDAQDVLDEALKYKVAFVPGIDFHVGNTGHNTFRLNFSNASPQMIEEGIVRLGRVLKSVI